MPQTSIARWQNSFAGVRRLARTAGRWLGCCVVALAVSAATLAGATAMAADTQATAQALEQQFRRGETVQALRGAQEAVKAKPNEPRLWFLLGVMLAELGRSAEAAQVYEAMTQAFPEMPEPYNNLAVLRAGEGRLDEARGLLEAALRMAPDYRTAHENMGDVLSRMALRSYQQAGADGPGAAASLQRKAAVARQLSALR